MKKRLLFILMSACFLLCGKLLQAQISGNKSIPGDYVTIQAAIAALNSQGVTSPGVTFNVAANHTETFTIATAGTLTTTTSSATAPIVFQKSGTGNNPKIFAAAGTTTNLDGIIKFAGTDYVTFHAIDLSESSSNTTTTTRMEWGYAILKASTTNGSQNITIRNCTVTLVNTHTATKAIYLNNHIATSTTTLSIASPAGTNSNCKIHNNTVTAYNPIYIYGSSAAAYYDYGNEIHGNTISTMGGTSTTCYGIYTFYQTNLSVKQNTLYGNTAQTGAMYGIYVATATNANITIDSNTVQLSKTGTTGALYGIFNSAGSTGTNNTVNIRWNTVSGFTYTTATSAAIYMIYNSGTPSVLNIAHNSISNTSTPNTGIFSGIYQAGSVVGESNIFNNTIKNLSRNGSSTSVCYGIYNTSGASCVSRIYNNEIGNITTAGSSGVLSGIVTVSGMTQNVYNNQIYNLSAGSVSGVAHGIHTAGTATTLNIYNNMISEIKAPASTNVNAVNGLNLISSTNINVYYNTVYLNASSTGSGFGSSAVNANVTPNLTMINNIFINNSTPSGTGNTVAFRRSGTNLLTYLSASNNNNFYAGTPGTNRLIFFDGTSSDQTFSAFRSRVSPSDLNSFTENTPFVNLSTSPYNLHINPSIATICESGGTVTGIPAWLTTDYDGQTRSTTFPDVGADEGTFTIAPDQFGPAIIYSDLLRTASITSRTLTNVNIMDISGVNTTTAKPRIYYKKSTDANVMGVTNSSSGNGWKWVETTQTSPPYSFLIDYSKLQTPVAQGDIIQYFIVAQDLVTTPNVSAMPDLGFVATSVSSITSAPSNPKSYPVMVSISGVRNIPGDYATLTGTGGLFEDLNNNRVLTGNLVVRITANITEPGTVALNKFFEDGAGGYFLTIRPDTNVMRTLSGSVTGGLIRLTAAERVIFDGRNNEAGSFLTFQNNSTSSNTAVFHLQSFGTASGCRHVTIRNCSIRAGSTSISSSFGVHIGGTSITTSATGADNDFISILENTFLRSYYGVYARGIVGTGLLDSMVISGNTFGSATSSDYITFRAIDLAQAPGVLVSKNEIRNMVLNFSSFISGVELGANCPDARISANKIYGMRNPYYYYDPSYYDEYGGGAYAIHINGANSNNVTIDNNVIYDILTAGGGPYYTTSQNPFGIRIASSTNHKIYYNSVNLYGAFSSTSTTNTGFSASLLIASSAATGCDIRNNTFTNSMTSFASSTKCYGIYLVGTTNISSINHNNYFTSGSYGILGYLGGDRSTLAAWKTASLQDSASISVNPLFTSNNNLLPISTSPLKNAGVNIPAVMTDFIGVFRPNTSTIGAYELNPFIPNLDAGVLHYTNVADTICGGITQIGVAVKNHGTNAFTGLTVNWSVNGIAQTPYVWNGTLAGNASANINIGNYTFMPGQSYTIVSSTINPNGFADINPANDTAVKTVLHVKPLPTAATSTTAFTICRTDSIFYSVQLTGTPPWTLSVTEGSSPVTYPGLTNTTFSKYYVPTVNTTYTLTSVSDATGCTNNTVLPVIVTVNPLPAANTGPAKAYCYGGNAVIGLSPVSGNTYSWSPATGLNNSSVSNPIAGPTVTTTYKLIETTTATGCKDSNTVVVSVNPIPVANAGINQVVASGDSTLLNGSASGTIGPWLYNWTPANLIHTPTLASAQTKPLFFTTQFTLLTTDAVTGCADSANVTVTISGGPLYSASSAFPSGICHSASSQLSVLTSGGTGTYTYTWSSDPPGYTSTSIPNPVVSPTVTTKYYVLISDGTLNRTDSITVTVFPNPNAAITPAGSTTLCQGGTVVLNAATGSGYQYKWYRDNVLLTGATTATLSTGIAGSHVVEVTDGNQCTSVSSPISVVVNPNPVATVTPAGPTSFCQGDSLKLSANQGAGLTYQWRFNAATISGATDSLYYAKQTGAYSLIATNSFNCSTTSSNLSITVNPVPTATITPAGSTTICSNASVTLNANTGTGLSYLWYRNSSLISGATLSNYSATLAGSYTVKVSNTFSCSQTSAAISVTHHPTPTSSITAGGPVSFCQGDSVLLTASTDIGTSWQWRRDGVTITGATAQTLWAKVSGAYTALASNTSCTVTSNAITVTSSPLPMAAIYPAGSTNLCPGTSVALNASSGTGYSHQWKKDGVNIPGATNSLYVATTAGSYVVVVTASGACIATSSPVVVTVNPAPTAAVTPSAPASICPGDSVILSANTGTGLTYQWRRDGILIAGATTSNHTAKLTGNYTVTVTNTPGCSTVSNIVTVTVVAAPAASITPQGPTTFCLGQSVTLQANFNSTFTYQWFKDGNPIAGATQQSFLATLGGVYTVRVTNSSGCSSVSTALVISLKPTPSINLGPDKNLAGTHSTTLDAGSGHTSYLWSTGANTQIITIVGSQFAFGPHPFSVTVTNTQGCANSDTVIVTVIDDTGIDRAGNNQLIRVFPNPGNGNFTLSFSKEINATVDITLTDVLGSEIHRRRLENADPRVNTDFYLSLPTGVYFLRIQSDGMNVTRRIIVK